MYVFMLIGAINLSFKQKLSLTRVVTSYVVTALYNTLLKEK
jgi:hypothetical protein